MTLYNILGVPTDATKKDIEKAYRKRAMTEHPDHGGDVDQFKELTLAYSILKDPVRRQRYDSTGQTDSPTSQQETLFRQLLVKGFTLSDKPIAAIITKLDNDIEALETDRAKLSSSKSMLRRRLDKFLKSNKSEIVQETIEAQIEIIDRGMNEMKESLDMFTRLKKDFKEFKEEKEKPKPMASDLPALLEVFSDLRKKAASQHPLSPWEEFQLKKKAAEESNK